jgi:hypothetical protein
VKLDNLYSVIYRFTATFFVFVAVCTYLSHDAVFWLHEQSHQYANEHNHDGHHNCGTSHQVVEYDRCKPESCDHDAHFAPENTPCFRCNLPPNSVHSDEQVTKSSFSVVELSGSKIIFYPSLLKGLNQKNGNRGPPYNFSSC